MACIHVFLYKLLKIVCVCVCVCVWMCVFMDVHVFCNPI
jgi:hypothetical protein